MPPFRTVYVMYDRGVRTGGPEALHQLVDMLRQLGQEAYLVPNPRSLGAQRVQEYERYDAPEGSLRDSPECAVVVAETDWALLSGIKKAARVCWWLSIDNSPLFFAERERLYSPSLSSSARLKNLARSAIAMKYRVEMRRLGPSGVFHLAQSHYAWHFLYSRLNVTPSLVTDYTSIGAPGAHKSPAISDRGRTVAYNTKKGRWLVDEVRKRDLAIEFRPIERMSRIQVIDLLRRTAVYLDVGHHPGKDRMPREAALAGALVIVARQGSAANALDVPLPWQHKVGVAVDPVEGATARLRSVFSDLSEHHERQGAYRRFVLGEYARFEREVTAFFVRGEYGSDMPGDSLAQGWLR